MWCFFSMCNLPDSLKLKKKNPHGTMTLKVIFMDIILFTFISFPFFWPFEMLFVCLFSFFFSSKIFEHKKRNENEYSFLKNIFIFPYMMRNYIINHKAKEIEKEYSKVQTWILKLNNIHTVEKKIYLVI